MNKYTVIYKPEFGGYTYEVRYGGRWVAEGWSLGSKRCAAAEVRNAIAKLQAAPQQKAAA